MRTWEWREQHCAWQALVCKTKVKSKLWIEADKRFRSREACNFFLICWGRGEQCTYLSATRDSSGCTGKFLPKRVRLAHIP